MAVADIAQFRQPHGEVVGGHGHWLAVKIAAQADFFRIGKNQWIGGGGIDFDVDDPARMGHGILAGPVDLGSAAQGVGVLHPGATFV